MDELMRKFVITLADTTTTQVGGATYSGNKLLPAIWLREIVDAATKRFYAAQFAYKTKVQAGNKDVLVPIRTHRMESGASNLWQASSGEASDINFTALTNLSGVLLQPTQKTAGFNISDWAIQTNAVDLVRTAREELVYFAGDRVDRTVFDALNSDSNRGTSTTRGSQAIYGGDATQASEIAAGDVLTTDMIAEAKRKLQSTTQKYWTYGTSEANSTAIKNPWTNEPNAPFVFFIAPEQEETLLTDSQFVNASEYGGDKIIHSGEIGEYLGIKIIVSHNTPNYAASVTHADSSTTAVAQHRCIFMKAFKSVALATAQEPQLVVFDWPTSLTKRLVMHQAYVASQLHSDAIVHVNVADE